MSLEYDIYGSRKPPDREVFLEYLTELLVNAGASVVSVSTRRDTISTDVGTLFVHDNDEESRMVTERVYGFRSGYELGFHAATTDQGAGHRVLLRLFSSLMAADDGDAVLEFNGETPVVVRLSGRLIVSANWLSSDSLFSFDDHLAGAFSVEDFPPPGTPLPESWRTH